MEPDAMILVFWMLSFKPTFSFSTFTFIKRQTPSWRFNPALVYTGQILATRLTETHAILSSSRGGVRRRQGWIASQNLFSDSLGDHVRGHPPGDEEWRISPNQSQKTSDYTRCAWSWLSHVCTPCSFSAPVSSERRAHRCLEAGHEPSLRGPIPG